MQEEFITRVLWKAARKTERDESPNSILVRLSRKNWFYYFFFITAFSEGREKLLVSGEKSQEIPA